MTKKGSSIIFSFIQCKVRFSIMCPLKSKVLLHEISFYLHTAVSKYFDHPLLQNWSLESIKDSNLALKSKRKKRIYAIPNITLDYEVLSSGTIKKSKTPLSIFFKLE